MAGRKKSKKYSVGLIPIIALSIALAVIILIVLGGIFDISPVLSDITDKIFDVIKISIEDNSQSKNPPPSGNVEVHFIDVGQGDSILIRTPQKNVLIDAGENNKGDLVVDYLRDLNIKNLDIVIGTHPHSDHIGGMDIVIDKMNVNTVIMPKLPDSMVPTTRTYMDLLKSIKNKGLKITPAVPYTEYDLGNGARLTILAPLTDLKGLNNMSVVSRLDFGTTSILFTGDIEKEAEKSLLENLDNIKLLDVDLLDTPHHGSRGSSTNQFLNAVTPDYAVISCAAENDYGHPHKEAVERLSKFCKSIKYTAKQGTVIVTTDGKEFSFNQ